MEIALLELPSPWVIFSPTHSKLPSIWVIFMLAGVGENLLFTLDFGVGTLTPLILGVHFPYFWDFIFPIFGTSFFLFLGVGGGVGVFKRRHCPTFGGRTAPTFGGDIHFSFLAVYYI